MRWPWISPWIISIYRLYPIARHTHIVISKYSNIYIYIYIHIPLNMFGFVLCFMYVYFYICKFKIKSQYSRSWILCGILICSYGKSPLLHHHEILRESSSHQKKLFITQNWILQSLLFILRRGNCSLGILQNPFPPFCTGTNSESEHGFTLGLWP